MATLTVEKLSKRYGAVLALDQVSAEFKSGQIHAVLGENGAGKSTLVSILSGFVTPDSGSVLLDTVPIPLGHAHQCRKAGIAMVHQHFTLVPQLTVQENLALDRLGDLAGALDLDTLARPALELAEELNWRVELGAKVGTLPVGVRQRIEILRILADRSPVVILDEPTATLGADEVVDLFGVLRSLRDQGRIVILIAHKLSEVMAVADQVTVLRNGRLVANAALDGLDQTQLAHWMVGELPPALQKEGPRGLEPGLSLIDVSAHGDRGEVALRDVTLDVRKGEVVGIGGVDGNGQLELAEIAAGVRVPVKGNIQMNRSGVGVGIPKIAYIPQDRQSDGLALEMTIEENLLIEGYRRPDLTTGPFLNATAIRNWSQNLIRQFEIKTPSPQARVGSMSGGNQQKVVVSRNLDQIPDVLVCFNPTRGLDIRAADFVQRQILRARDEGAAVLLISTDLDELAALADRTFFLSSGCLKEPDGGVAMLGGM